jgi:hypothetical protein
MPHRRSSRVPPDELEDAIAAEAWLTVNPGGLWAQANPENIVAWRGYARWVVGIVRRTKPAKRQQPSITRGALEAYRAKVEWEVELQRRERRLDRMWERQCRRAAKAAR